MKHFFSLPSWDNLFGDNLLAGAAYTAAILGLATYIAGKAFATNSHHTENGDACPHICSKKSCTQAHKVPGSDSPHIRRHNGCQCVREQQHAREYQDTQEHQDTPDLQHPQRLHAPTVPSPVRSSQYDKHTYGAILCALATFWCIPWGPLPGLMGYAYNSFAVLVLVLFSHTLLPAPHNTEERVNIVLLLATVSLLGWYALQRGMPGAPYSLDAFMNTPLLGNSPPDTHAAPLAGIFLLAAAAMPCTATMRTAAREERAPTILPHTLRLLALCAVWCCLFIPQGISATLHLYGAPALVIDALYFWFSMLTIAAASSRLPLPRLWLCGRICCVLMGALLIFCSQGC